MDTDVDPVILLDLIEVADVLGDIVSDLDTTGVSVPLAVKVVVLDTDVDPDTEFVEERLPVEL